MRTFLTSLLAVFCFHICADAACATLPSNSVCGAYLSGSSFQATIPSEKNLFMPTSLWPGLSSACLSIYAQAVCQTAYTPCNTSAPLPCSGTCTQLSSSCSTQELQLINIVNPVVCASPGVSAPACQALLPATSLPASLVAISFARCETYKGSICKNALASVSTVYVAAGSSQSDIESQLLWVNFKKQLVQCPRDNSCVYRSLDFYCGLMFPACDTTQMASTLKSVTGITASIPSLPLPRLSCLATCQNVNTYCGTTWFNSTARSTLSAYAAPNCASQGVYVPISNGSDFPASQSNTWGTLVDANSTPVLTLCQQGRTWSFANSTQKSTFVPLFNAFQITKDSFPCPPPLVAPDNQDHTKSNVAKGICGQRCPSINMSSSVKSNHNVIVLAGNILSFFFGIYTLLTYVLFEKKREQLLNVNYSLCFMIWTLINLIAWAYRYDEFIGSVGCVDNTTLDAPSTVTFCRVWLPITVWCGNSMLYSWLSIISDLSLKIIFQYRMSKEDSYKLQQKMVACCWILSAIQSISVASIQGASGSIYGSVPCSTNSIAAEYIAVDIMMVVCGSIGLSLTMYMLYLFRQNHTATQGDNHGSKGSNVLLHASLRLLLISFLMGLYFLFISLNNFMSPIGSEKQLLQLADIQTFANCIADTWGDLIICGENPQLNPIGMVWFIVQFLYSSPGLIAFIILGMQQGNFVLWGILCGCVADPSVEDNKANASNSHLQPADSVNSFRESGKYFKKGSVLFPKSHGNRTSAFTAPTFAADQGTSDARNSMLQNSLIAENDSEKCTITSTQSHDFSLVFDESHTPSSSAQHIQLIPVHSAKSMPKSLMSSQSQLAYTNMDFIVDESDGRNGRNGRKSNI